MFRRPRKQAKTERESKSKLWSSFPEPGRSILKLVDNLPSTTSCYDDVWRYIPVLELLIAQGKLSSRVCPPSKSGVVLLHIDVKRQHGHWHVSDSQVYEGNLRTWFSQDTFQHLLRACAGSILALPVRIVDARGNINHLNTLIIDFRKRQVERFEPLGSIPLGDLDLVLDTYFLEHVVERLGDDWAYIEPAMILCPSEEKGPQHLEATPAGCKRKSGFCVTVAMMYAHMRVLLPDANPADVAEQLVQLLKLTRGQIVLQYVTWMESVCPLPEQCEALLSDFFGSE